MGIFLAILSLKYHHFLPFLLEKQSKLAILVGKRKPSKFEENSKINIYSLVPQSDHLVALCAGCLQMQIMAGSYSVMNETISTKEGRFPMVYYLSEFRICPIFYRYDNHK